MIKITLNEFHGGGIVSRHKSIRTAYLAMRRLKKNTDCTCGCFDFAGSKDDLKILERLADPYAVRDALRPFFGG